MRFFRDGPDIDDELLEQRDEGKVVFICGSGVSQAGGLPSFVELTRHVIDSLHPPDGSEICRAFEPWRHGALVSAKTPLDQIYDLLIDEYDEVHSLMAEKLYADGNACAGKHDLLLKISSDRQGKPQIVTTNFDDLFEKALARCPQIENRFCYPRLPDLQENDPVAGIAYLHGRLKKPGEIDEDEINNQVVLSSTDFGAAYLADGQATRFICSLVRRYTVVFIGYSAEDPLMGYLLRGLKKHDLHQSPRLRLYAFDKGAHADIEAKWQRLGVKVISYGSHPILWKTIKAWAERATDPPEWKKKAVRMARKGPRELEPHERGQVAHLIGTDSGAELFAAAEFSLPAEWLCVFDAQYRVCEGRQSGGEEGGVLFEYALDGELPLPAGEAFPHLPNFLGWRRPGDGDPADSLHLDIPEPDCFGNDLSPRLNHLKQWIGKSMNQPITAWWVASKKCIHPQLLGLLEENLQQSACLCPAARCQWGRILECHRDRRRLEWESEWDMFKGQIRDNEWGENIVRRYENLAAPFLIHHLTPFPCIEDFSNMSWDAFSSGGIVTWETKFPSFKNLDDSRTPKEKELLEVFGIAERHMLQAIELLKVSEKHWFSFENSITCYPEEGVRDRYLRPCIVRSFDWFLRLFKKVISQRDAPDALKSRVLSWPKSDRFFFGILYLYALAQELFSDEEAGKEILRFPHEQFWSRHCRRDLLLLIKARWTGFSDDVKNDLAERILDGSGGACGAHEEERRQKSNEDAIRYARWMRANGLVLPEPAANRLEKLVSEAGWNEADAEDLARMGHENPACSEEPDKNEDLETILKLSPAEIMPRIERIRAEGDDFPRESDLFARLVEKCPKKALEALLKYDRREEHSCHYWEEIFRKWPGGGDDEEAFRTLQYHIRRMPCGLVRKINHGIAAWTEGNFRRMLDLDEDLAWETFDCVAKGLMSDNGSAAICDSKVKRIPGRRYRQVPIIEKAGRSPIGKITNCCLDAFLDAAEASSSSSRDVLKKFEIRLERLLDCPGNGGKHVTTIISSKLHELCDIDPNWTEAWIAPALGFDGHDAHAAWSGYFLANLNLPEENRISRAAKVFSQYKPILLRLLSADNGSEQDDGTNAVIMRHVTICFMRRENQGGGFAKKEIRDILRSIGDLGRREVVDHLNSIGQSNPNCWVGNVAPFIHDVWPRETRYKTGDLLFLWVDLLCRTGDAFPKVYKSLRPFLMRPSRTPPLCSFFLKKVLGEGGGGLAPIAEQARLYLDFLDRVIPVHPNEHDIPDELEKAMIRIKQSDESLARKQSFARLSELACRKRRHNMRIQTGSDGS